MGAKGRLEATDPDSIEFTLSLTMSLKQWRELQGQLSSSYPSWKLSAMITKMIALATERYQETEELDP